MGINQFIERMAKQYAVYWEYSGPDGYGGSNYEDPVEIQVRWQDSTELITDATGKEIVSNAAVWTSEDLNDESVLWLGRLTSLDSDELANPMKVSGTRTIKKFSKIPNMGLTGYVRKAYL